MNPDQPHYLKKSVQGLKGHYVQTYSVALFFFLLCILSAALCFLSPFTLIFTVPLLVAPGFFMFIASIGGFVWEKGFNFGTVNVWVIFRNYFHPGYFGCFRMLRNLARGFLTFLVSALVIGSILSIFGESIWPGFTIAMNEFYNRSQTSSVWELVSFLEGNSILLSYVSWTSVGAAFLGVFSFLRGLSFYAMNAYLCAAVRTDSSRVELAMYKEALRKERKRYYPLSFSLSWPLIPLYIVGFWGGFFLGRAVAPASISAFPFALIGASFALCLFLPFYGAGLYLLFGDMETCFMTYSLEATQRAIEELEAQGKLEKDDLEIMKKSVEEMNKAIDEVEKRKKEEQQNQKETSDDSKDSKEE